MRKAISVLALLLALTCPVYAGDMPNGSPHPPPPAPADATQEPAGDATLNGEMHTPGVSDILTETALKLLAALPSLL